MPDKFFLDTNIFVYSFDDTAREKQRQARELIKSALQSGNGHISFQVYYHRPESQPKATVRKSATGNGLFPASSSSFFIFFLFLPIISLSKLPFLPASPFL